MIPATILGTSQVRPATQHPTAQVLAQTGIDRSLALIEAKTGIRSRGWFEPGTEHADVGARAVRAACQDAGLAPQDLSRLLFVNSMGGDFLVPATGNAVLDALDVRGSCSCFDMNNACMGFLTALDLAARHVATGQHPVAIVAVELHSPYISPEDPRPWLVLADAAACAILGRPESGAGILGSSFGNDGSLRGSVTMGHPGLSNEPERIVFGASNARITEGGADAVQRAAQAALDQAGLGIADMDWVLPHQPNGSMFRRIVQRLGADPARTVPVVQELGAVGAASIGVSLDELRRRHGIEPGQRVLLAGVGAGVSFGAIVYQEEPAYREGPACQEAP